MNIAFAIVLIIAIVAQVADGLSTRKSLALGASETNPILVRLLGPTLKGIVALKLGVALLIAMFGVGVLVSDLDATSVGFLVAALGAGAAVTLRAVYGNVLVIQRLSKGA